MTNKDKQSKLLYKKYAHLEYPDLIRRAIQVERDCKNRQRLKMRNECYYKNKKFYLSIKRELKKDINDLRNVDKYMTIDYYTLDRGWIMQSKMKALMDIETQIWELDKQHKFYKMGRY